MMALSRLFKKTRLCRSRVFFHALTLGLLLAVNPAQAEEDADRRFSLKGFGTLGMVKTNSREVEFVRDLSQGRGAKDEWTAAVDSILGVQATYRWSRELEATAQAVTRYRYDGSFDPELAWAFVKFRPTAETTVRVGRLGTDFFQLSDSRLVGYSYLQVRPPGDFFWHLPFYHIDGADAVAIWPVGEHVLRGKVFTGISHERLALADQVWDLSGSRMSGASLSYQMNSWLLRASYASIRFSHDLPLAGMMGGVPAADQAAVLDALHVARTSSDYYSLAAIYDHGPWEVQAMVNRIEQGSRVFEPSYSLYGLAGYRLGSVTPFVAYGRARSSPRASGLDGLAGAVAASFMRDAHVDQHTVSAGVRWDVARNVAIKTQFDQVRGSASSIFPYRRETGNWDGRLNVLSLSLDFLF